MLSSLLGKKKNVREKPCIPAHKCDAATTNRHETGARRLDMHRCPLGNATTLTVLLLKYRGDLSRELGFSSPPSTDSNIITGACHF
jgi:hypothetical protein